MAFKIMRPFFNFVESSVSSIHATGIIRNDFESNTEYALWQSGGSYADGEIVRYEVYEGHGATLSDVKLYRSTIANNQTEPAENNEFWVLYGTDNKWAMFDQVVNTRSRIRTGNNSVASLIFGANFEGTLHLFNLHCDFVIVRYYNASGSDLNVVGTPETYIVNPSGLDSEEFEFNTYLSVPIPPRPNSNTRYLELEFHRAGGYDIEVGSVLYGEEFTVPADIELGLDAPIQSYKSRKEDQFGNVDFKQRGQADRLNFTCQYDKSDFNAIRRIFKRVQGEYIVLVPTDDPDYVTLNVFGYCESFRQIVSYKTQSAADIQIFGII